MQVNCKIQKLSLVIILFTQISVCQKCKVCQIDVYFEKSEFGNDYRNLITKELESFREEMSSAQWTINWYYDAETKIQFISNIFEEDKIQICAASCEFNQFLLKTLAFSNAAPSPTILISNGPCPRKMNVENVHFIVLSMKTFHFDVLQLIEDLHDYGQIDWTTMSLIYDTNIDEGFLSVLLQNTHLFSKRKQFIPRKIFKLPHNRDNVTDFMEEMFQNISMEQIYVENFLVFCDDSTNVQNMLKVAETADYLTHNTQWLIISNNSHLMNINSKQILGNSTTNMAVIYPTFGLNYSTNINEYISATKIFQSHLRNILRHITQPIKTNTEQIYSTYYIETYLGNDMSESHETIINLWTIEERFLNKQNVILYPNLKETMQNKKFIVITSNNEPEQIISPSNCTNEDCEFTGVSADILKALQQSLKFKYTLKVLPDISAWNETINMFKNKEAHFAAISFLITQERSKQADFTVAIDTSPYTMISAQPKEIKNEFLLFKAVQMEVWIYLLVTLVTLSIIMYTMQSIHQSVHINDTNYNYLDLRRYIFTLSGILLQQGMSMLPNRISNRIIILVWFFSTVVFTATFTGNIVAFLTMPRFTKQMRNFDDLVNNNENITWGYHKFSPIRIKLTKTHDDDNTYEYVKAHAEVHDDINDEIWDRIKNEKHVLLEDRAVIISYLQEKYDKDKKSGEYVLGDELAYESGGFVFMKHFPFMALINKQINTMTSAGLTKKFWNIHSPDRENRLQLKPMKKKILSFQVSMTDLQGPLIVLFIGYGVGLGAVTIELGLSKLQYYK